jgi:dihydroneopterin aldolase
VNTLRAVPSSASVSQTEIALAGMQFHVRVGVLPHEREIPQPLEIDLAVRHDAARTAVLDYRDLYAAANETVQSDPLTYLEPLAERIAARALAIDGVTWCRVAVRKPHVALGGPLAFAQVAVERTNA